MLSLLKFGIIFISFIFYTVDSLCPCGQLHGNSYQNIHILKNSTRIIGGVLSKGNSWPWAAAIVQQDGIETIQYCGSSILNSLYILTAAHCLYDIGNRDMNNQYVFVGDHKLNGTHISKHKIQSFKIHPQFKRKTLDNDIALIRLASPIAFNNPNVQPTCLSTRNGNSQVGQRATVIGWGSIKTNGPTVNSQRQVQVQIVPRNICQRNYARDGISVTPNMICATAMSKDSCAGDSGGPLIVKAKNSNHYEQVGIVSFGKSCGLKKFPGIYTNLFKYKNWIEQNTKDAGRC